MRIGRILGAAVVATLLAGSAGQASAQGMGDGMHHRMMRHHMMKREMHHRMMMHHMRKHMRMHRMMRHRMMHNGM